MSQNYCPIMSTLGYVLSPDRQNVLMTHRISRKSDEQFGKYNGLGGHMLPDEDIATCMIREIKEEANIDVTKMTLRGTVNWTSFGPHAENWIAFIFLITAFDGTPTPKSVEGPLSWIPLKDVMSLNLYEGDRYFMPLVFDDDPRPYTAYILRFGEENNVPVAETQVLYGRLWRQGIPYQTLMENNINHPNPYGLSLFGDALMALFGKE